MSYHIQHHKTSLRSYPQHLDPYLSHVKYIARIPTLCSRVESAKVLESRFQVCNLREVGILEAETLRDKDMIGQDRVGRGTVARAWKVRVAARETYMHILREVARRQVGTRVAEITASRRRHFLSLARHYFTAASNPVSVALCRKLSSFSSQHPR